MNCVEVNEPQKLADGLLRYDFPLDVERRHSIPRCVVHLCHVLGELVRPLLEQLQHLVEGQLLRRPPLGLVPRHDIDAGPQLVRHRPHHLTGRRRSLVRPVIEPVGG